jgi:pyridoxamine 5'-phosphate oxidase
VTVPRPGEAVGEEQQRLVKLALDNFVLVVLDPIEIDLVELAPIPNRRTMWVKKGTEWEEQIVVP